MSENSLSLRVVRPLFPQCIVHSNMIRVKETTGFFCQIRLRGCTERSWAMYRVHIHARRPLFAHILSPMIVRCSLRKFLVYNLVHGRSNIMDFELGNKRLRHFLSSVLTVLLWFNRNTENKTDWLIFKWLKYQLENISVQCWTFIVNSFRVILPRWMIICNSKWVG